MGKKRAAASVAKSKPKRKAKASKKKLAFKKRMSRAERLTHYGNLILNFDSRYQEAVEHEAKMLLAKELLKALKWEIKNKSRTVTHM